jgi:hypothetical protein
MKVFTQPSSDAGSSLANTMFSTYWLFLAGFLVRTSGHSGARASHQENIHASEDDSATPLHTPVQRWPTRVGLGGGPLHFSSDSYPRQHRRCISGLVVILHVRHWIVILPELMNSSQCPLGVGE